MILAGLLVSSIIVNSVTLGKPLHPTVKTKTNEGKVYGMIK
jgi:hypothetical protein